MAVLAALQASLQSSGSSVLAQVASAYSDAQSALARLTVSQLFP